MSKGRIYGMCSNIRFTGPVTRVECLVGIIHYVRAYVSTRDVRWLKPFLRHVRGLVTGRNPWGDDK